MYIDRNILLKINNLGLNKVDTPTQKYCILAVYAVLRFCG